jgi:hypothetical protein
LAQKVDQLRLFAQLGVPRAEKISARFLELVRGVFGSKDRAKTPVVQCQAAASLMINDAHYEATSLLSHYASKVFSQQTLAGHPRTFVAFCFPSLCGIVQ